MLPAREPSTKASVFSRFMVGKMCQDGLFWAFLVLLMFFIVVGAFWCVLGCFGAFWGEVNTAIHKGLGCLGVVTNGSFRDIDACAPGFQLLGGKVTPSHAWVHLVAIECEVNIFGMAVKPNDIIHADRHGAVVVPNQCVKALPDAIDLLTRREAVILDVARSPDFNVEILKKAMADSAEIH